MCFSEIEPYNSRTSVLHFQIFPSLDFLTKTIAELKNKQFGV